MSTAVNETVARRAGARGWIGLAVLMLPVLLVSVDNTILNFALPEISEALKPTGTELLWILDAYPLVLAGLLVTMGSLGDRVGRRRLLMIGAIGFGAVSALAAFAPSAIALIAARAAMGLFGATLMPSTLSLLRNLFLDREQRRVAIAIWAAGFAGGAALGPIVGGILLEHFAWGAVFLIAVPVLLPLVVLLPILVPESKDPVGARIDLVSAALVLLTMVPLVFAIKHTAESGIDVTGAAAGVVAIVSGTLFIRRQLVLEHPLLDLGLFSERAFGGAVLVNLLSVVALVGGLLFITQHLQLVLGLSPLDAGLVLVPGMIVMILAGLLVVPVARRVRPSVLIPCALVFSFLAYGTVAVLGGDIDAWGVGVVMVLLGLGIGAAETVSNDLILANAPADKAGAASGLSETAYELGSVLGTAVLGTILTSAYRAAVVVPDGLGAAASSAAGETLGGAVSVAADLPADTASALLDSAVRAFDGGVGLTAGIGAVLVVVAGAVGALTLRRAR